MSGLRKEVMVAGRTVLIMILIAGLIVAGGVFALITIIGDDGSEGAKGTPIEAFQDWIEAYNGNDWGGAIEISSLHFTPSAVQDAHIAGIGNISCIIDVNNLTLVPSESIPSNKASYIEAHLDRIFAGHSGSNYSQYRLVRYDMTLNYPNHTDVDGRTYTVMMEVDGEWYRTFIDIPGYLWDSEMWVYDWYVPRPRTTMVTFCDNDVRKMVIVGCPETFSFDDLFLSISFYANDIDTMVRNSLYLGDGMVQDIQLIKDRGTIDNITYEHRYAIGAVDIEGDGVMSAGDFFFIDLEPVTMSSVNYFISALPDTNIYYGSIYL